MPGVRTPAHPPAPPAGASDVTGIGRTLEPSPATAARAPPLPPAPCAVSCCRKSAIVCSRCGGGAAASAAGAAAADAGAAAAAGAGAVAAGARAGGAGMPAPPRAENTPCSSCGTHNRHHAGTQSRCQWTPRAANGAWASPGTATRGCSAALHTATPPPPPTHTHTHKHSPRSGPGPHQRRQRRHCQPGAPAAGWRWRSRQQRPRASQRGAACAHRPHLCVCRHRQTHTIGSVQHTHARSTCCAARPCTQRPPPPPNTHTCAHTHAHTRDHTHTHATAHHTRDHAPMSCMVCSSRSTRPR
jgi:hypothetical protein